MTTQQNENMKGSPDWTFRYAILPSCDIAIVYALSVVPETTSTRDSDVGAFGGWIVRGSDTSGRSSFDPPRIGRRG